MTCYETLRASAPAADAPMAHHFVKWWRNKFRNGYKKFTMSTESERTDTEELIDRAASQCSAPPDLLPSEARALLQPTPVPPPLPARKSENVSKRVHAAEINTEKTEDKQPRLRFEELTCDVELQHPESSKQQPLQFSFTLYDLDGHGRMTKDDIAGIVSTIYESIGKSVTVPHYGSKTIQVRLTVVPEDGQTRNHRERPRRRRKEQHRANTQPPDNNNCVDNSENEQHERLSNDDDASSKSSCSDQPIRQPVERHMPFLRQRPHRHARREPRERKHTKKRSGSLQRKELLEIIQANMEKNHLSFQATRKPSETVANEEEIMHKYQKLRNRSYTVSDRTAFQKSKPEPSNNGYLDLACGGDSNLCRYDRYLHAVICSSARHANTGYHQKRAHGQPSKHRTSHNLNSRSRSHDVPQIFSNQPRVLQIIFL